MIREVLENVHMYGLMESILFYKVKVLKRYYNPFAPDIAKSIIDQITNFVKLKNKQHHSNEWSRIRTPSIESKVTKSFTLRVKGLKSKSMRPKATGADGIRPCCKNSNVKRELKSQLPVLALYVVFGEPSECYCSNSLIHS